ncbi:MAG TPA: DUF1990 family protein [Glaciibacter sp.]|nr:DUF1990 family protein [Glaciibacter sp.]
MSREWPSGDHSYRRSEVSAVAGRGDMVWARAARDVLRWRVKTASGFTVDSTGPVARGERVIVKAHLFGLSILEPVEVVAVVEEADRVGFAYRTMPGHPVSGEEAFILHRQGEEVRLTIRSLTRAAPQQPWRILYPVLRTTQRFVRWRYLRALR